MSFRIAKACWSIVSGLCNVNLKTEARALQTFWHTVHTFGAGMAKTLARPFFVAYYT